MNIQERIECTNANHMYIDMDGYCVDCGKLVR